MTEVLRPLVRDNRQSAGELEIGLVCPYSLAIPGGVQNHVLGLAGYLTAAGDRVRVLAPGELDPERARQHGLDPARFTSVGPALPVPYNGSVARVTVGPISAARTRRWLAGHRFDVVHIHEPLAPGPSVTSLISCRVPTVATFHTATPRSRMMQVAGTALRGVIDRIGAGIAVSEPARRVVLDHLGRDPEVIPNGFRVAEFDHGHTGGRWRAGDHPRLVFLGRLDEQRKGLDVLLTALPAIRRQHPDLEVVIAGQGNLRRVARRLPADCVALGAVDDSTRADLLAHADLFVAPHLDRESFGIVLIEAIAAGASVVASDLPAFTDLLRDHETGGGEPLGFIFPAGDAAELARTVDLALATDRRRLNARARSSMERYDWSRVGPSIRRVYADLVG